MFVACLRVLGWGIVSLQYYSLLIIRFNWMPILKLVEKFVVVGGGGNM